MFKKLFLGTTEINFKMLGTTFYKIFIVETIIVGKLLKINPFDQPAVEEVKNNTKKMLS